MQHIPFPDKSRHRIGLRTKAVSANNTIIVKTLREQGMGVSLAQYSAAVNGNSCDDKADRIVEAADKLLTQWEQQIISEYGEKALLYNPKKITA